MPNYKKAVAGGFTLIELLVVIGILGILLAIILIAINPARQFGLANNTKRQSDANTILNSISQYMVDSRGKAPTGMTATPALFQSGDPGTAICNSLVPKYVSQLPYEPSAPTTYKFTSCSDFNTGYNISVDAAGRVTVAATIVDNPDNASPPPSISVTR